MLYVHGIDPGVKHVGYAVVEYPERKLIHTSTIELGGIGELMVLHSILKSYPPTLIAIEEPFAGRSIRDYGATKEVIGAMRMILDAYVHDGIISTTPQAGNVRLGLGEKGAKHTDKAKREAASSIFYPFKVNNGHEASAVAAAIAGWDKYCVEVLDAVQSW